MNASVTWKDADVVCEWDKQQAKSLIKDSWLAITKAIWLLWLLVFPAAWYYWKIYPPEDLSRSFVRLFLLGLLSPTLVVAFLVCLPLVPTLFLRFRCGYKITEKGIFNNSVTQSSRISWKRIESYCFVDHEGVAGIRVLEFKLRSKAKCKFDLNPQQVEESEIQALLDAYFKKPREK